MRVEGKFASRGGLSLTVTAEHPSLPSANQKAVPK